jgi:hypothetical protein
VNDVEQTKQFSDDGVTRTRAVNTRMECTIEVVEAWKGHGIAFVEVQTKIWGSEDSGV